MKEEIDGLREELLVTSINRPWLRDNILKCMEVGISLDELQLYLESLVNLDKTI